MTDDPAETYGRLLWNVDADSELNRKFGRLEEGLHATSYMFERVCKHLEWLLEGDRWRLGGRFDDVNAFLDSLRLGELRIHAESRTRIAKRIKELQPTASNRQIAKTLGVGHTTVNRDMSGPSGPQKDEKNEHDQRRGGSTRSSASEMTGEEVARMAERKVSGTAEKKERRAEREQALAAKQLAMPTGKFNVIVVDDEQDHEVYSRETGMDRHASNHYPTSVAAHTAEEMHAWTKDRFDCAADDCVMFQWSTVQHLDVMIDLLRLRGFRYVSHYVWGKDKIGLGYWNRNKHEILLIGTRGNIPCPAPGEQWDSLIMAPRGEHSAKPECFLEMIEQYFPNLPKIELLRRGPARPGWSAWGNEAETEAAE